MTRIWFDVHTLYEDIISMTATQRRCEGMVLHKSRALYTIEIKLVLI